MQKNKKPLERAVIVHIQFKNQNIDKDDLLEFQELVTSAGVEIAETITGSRPSPDPKYFVGEGKATEIRDALAAHKSDVVLFNHALSPAQQRNLEKYLEASVIDRTGLILDIFAQRARTHEGKLQVELAQLQHLATRLVHGWTHLERQKGGIGLRGPGETQLETDRRLISDRIKKIKKRLDQVRSQRQQNRQSRQRKPVPVVALVGYTNAGKSTLFNVITGAKVYAADKLFATLDPTLRRITLPEIGEVIMVDTVGFIRHLPHGLVQAFRATLEETRQADLLLHVIDVSHPLHQDNIAQVETVLQEIAAHEIPCIKVFNKIDLLTGFEPRIDYDADMQPIAAYVSAQQPLGLDLLKQAIQQQLTTEFIIETITLSPKQAKLRAALYDLQAVQEETLDEQGNWQLVISLSKMQYDKLILNNKNS